MSNRAFMYGAMAMAMLASMNPRPAAAADMTAPFNPGADIAQPKVDFASGWYIRGDVAFDRDPFGIAPTPAVPMVSSLAGFTNAVSNSYDLSLGGGYKFTNWFRTDLMLDWHRKLQSSATGSPAACTIGLVGTPAAGPFTGEVPVNTLCTPTSAVSLTRYDALANVYIDLGTFSSVTPYVGAGVGVTFGHQSGATTWLQPNNSSYNVNYTDALNGATYHAYWDRSYSADYLNLAWALMAGVAIDITDHAKLDIGYRYLNLGHQTGVSANGTVSSTPVYENEIRAGIRYMID